MTAAWVKTRTTAFVPPNSQYLYHFLPYPAHTVHTLASSNCSVLYFQPSCRLVPSLPSLPPPCIHIFTLLRLCYYKSNCFRFMCTFTCTLFLHCSNCFRSMLPPPPPAATRRCAWCARGTRRALPPPPPAPPRWTWTSWGQGVALLPLLLVLVLLVLLPACGQVRPWAVRTCCDVPAH